MRGLADDHMVQIVPDALVMAHGSCAKSKIKDFLRIYLIIHAIMQHG